MLAVTNKRNDLFAVGYHFDAGYEQLPLLCNALTIFEQSGTKELTAKKLQETLFAQGTSVSTSCSDNESSLSISGIDRNMEPSLALIKQWLSDVNVDDATVAKMVENMISTRKDRVAEPRFVAGALSEFAAHDRRSTYLSIPSNKTLQSTKADTLRAAARSLLALKHRTTYFGPRAGAEAQAGGQAETLQVSQLQESAGLLRRQKGRAVSGRHLLPAQADEGRRAHPVTLLLRVRRRHGWADLSGDPRGSWARL
jgi:hypothetical protein